MLSRSVAKNLLKLKKVPFIDYNKRGAKIQKINLIRDGPLIIDDKIFTQTDLRLVKR